VTHDIESNGYSSNPFATRFVSSGRLGFIGLAEGALDQLAETLIQQNGNGQIVGPHGVGKTTLTYELENRIAECSDVNTPFNFVRKTIGPRGAMLEPDLERFTSVVEALTADREFELSSERLSQVFLENQGNVREALMSCYDEFEASRARTAC